MSEKCPKCGSPHKKMSMPPGYGYYECGSYDGPAGSGWVESHTCIRHQLAQKGRELEQAKLDIERLRRKDCLVCGWCAESFNYEVDDSGEIVNMEETIKAAQAHDATCSKNPLVIELEQSRQREAQALAVVARVKEWAAKEYNPMLPDNPLDLDTILADAPKVLAVVDGWAGCDCLWDDPDGEYGLHIPDTPEEDEPSTPVRVIVLGRDESEGT